MEHNGVREFRYVGGRFSDGQHSQAGSPGMLYCIGGHHPSLAVVRAVLFRIDDLKKARAKNGTKDTLLL